MTVPDSPTGETSQVEQTSISDASTAAVSSPAEDQGAKSMLDAVQTALKPADKDSETPPGSQTPEKMTQPGDKPGDKADEPLPDEVSEEELKDAKPKTAKRIRQLLGKTKELDGQVKALSEKAQGFDAVVDFCQRSNLSQEDLNSGLETLALIKSDPRQAYDRLVPIVRELQKVVGEVLPDDLKEEVRLGYITEARARELAKARATSELSERRREIAERQREAETEERRLEAFKGDVKRTADDWQNRLMASDPDWHLKSNRVHELIELAVYRNGYPKTTKEVVDIADAALKQATDELRKAVGKPKPVAPPASETTSTRTVAEPKSMLDAVRLGLGR